MAFIFYCAVYLISSMVKGLSSAGWGGYKFFYIFCDLLSLVVALKGA